MQRNPDEIVPNGCLVKDFRVGRYLTLKGRVVLSTFGISSFALTFSTFPIYNQLKNEKTKKHQKNTVFFTCFFPYKLSYVL